MNALKSNFCLFSPSVCSDRFCVLDNWALIHAQQLALQENLPLHVCVCLHVPESELSTLRHYSFMLKGLEEVAKVSKDRADKRSFNICVQPSVLPLSHRSAEPWTFSSTCYAALRGSSFQGLFLSISWEPW